MSIAVACSKGFHGLEIPLRSIGGASAVRVVHGHGQVIEPHRHDWVCITLPVLGGAIETWDGGEARIGGPCVLVHPAGAYHADRVGDEGLETVSFQFDPRWLSIAGLELRLKKSLWRTAGPDARELVRLWSQPHGAEADLARSTVSALHKIISAEPVNAPPWLQLVAGKIAGDERVTTVTLAAELDLHPAWLARAYRATVGEGVQEAARRRRVGRAVQFLRRSDLALAQIAADCGFCDQSHMTRDFRIVLGRTPLRVRSEQALLESPSASID